MFLKKFLPLILAVFTPVLSFCQTDDFNADTVYAHIKHLTVNIGPRPMGSLNERIALAWTVEKFVSYGADTAYVMELKHFKKGKRAFNTNSGIAVGIFHGKTDSSIVVGGHIDSANPEIAGANDDASGTASVIELARIWSKKDRHYTMVFTAFGGEEKGLVGSSYFVDHYQDLDNVALMLQIDMTASDDDIMTLIDSDSSQAPIWLVKDAFAMDRSLGINRLSYPAHFSTINNLANGAGSDHMPFLLKNIPAIDFTSGINKSPIHTQQDILENVSKDMLKKCGLLVNGLITKYQNQGIPTAKNDRYELWQFFGILLFIPPWLIKIFIAGTIILSVAAFYHSRKHRLMIPKKERVRFSGWKLFLMLIIMAISFQVGEALIQFFKGVRYPWYIHVNKYLLFAAIWTILGIWVSLQLTRKWKFSPDPYVYTKRALIVLSVFLLFTCFGSARLALYPSYALFLVSLAILIPNSIVKIILILLSPILLLKLMFMEAFIFLARGSASIGLSINNFWASLLYSGLLVLLLVIWYLPFIYSFSFGIINVKSMKHFFKTVRKPLYGVVIFIIAIGFGGYLYSLPAYNDMWRPQIHIDANYDMKTKESKLTIAGSEFLKNVQVISDSINKTYAGSVTYEKLQIAFDAQWLKIIGEENITKGEKDTINIDWQLVNDFSPLNVTLDIKVDTAEIKNVSSNLSYIHDKNRIQFTWFGDLPERLNVSASFTVESGSKLIRTISGEYTNMPVFIKVYSDLADITYRTNVVYRDTLLTTR